MRRILLLLLCLAPLLLFYGLSLAQQDSTISGTIVGTDGPLPGAWVRVQATTNLTYAGAEGSFMLSGVPAGSDLTVTAWYTEHKIGWAVVRPPSSAVTIRLRPYDPGDNPWYAWNTSLPDPASPEMGCGHCMFPAFPEWQRSAHSGSAVNPRFFSLYNGSDITGTQVVSPGYKLDFPSTAGNCAACHAPGAASDAPLETDMNSITGVAREGVFCEFCHKIGAVHLDPVSGRPNDDAPGVMSLRLYRPYPGEQVFFGTLDDVTRRVSYLPLEKRSQFCAPCHQFSFGQTPIYQSFREWQESTYPAAGIECQTCHMPAGTSPTFVLPEKGGLARDPSRLASHLDLGTKDLAFMQSTVSMTVTAQQIADRLQVNVTLTNAGAGHHVPTDYPGRQMLLVVAASDASSANLQYLGELRIPAWGGSLAAQPGKAFAKILKDVETGASPVVSYWKPTVIESDNRIPALASNVSTYAFALPAGGEMQVQARLFFRRTFAQIMEDKDWQTPDIVLAETSLTVSAQPVQRVYLPVVGK